MKPWVLVMKMLITFMMMARPLFEDYENKMMWGDNLMMLVRQEVVAPEAAVTLQQAIPEDESTVTIKLQGLKRKRVTVTICDDKAA